MQEEKVWFVTGSSSGIGRAVVEYALSQGSKVVATCRKPDDLSDLLKKYGPSQLLVVKLDVSNASEIVAAFQRALEVFSRVDVVYNNAAYAIFSEIEGTPDDVARKEFDVNFWGAVNVSREAVRVFRDVNSPPGGRLLQASSVASIKTNVGLGFYAATKSALENLSESLQLEVHPSWNIKVTVLQFGGVLTRVFDEGSPSTLVVPPHPAYNNPDDVMYKLRTQWDGISKAPLQSMLSDPKKVAREVFDIAGNQSVGFRVLLGQDTLMVAKDKLKELQEIVEEGERFSADLKFDP
ncbi:hypothetical protein D9619_000101 [Psilocybe cf. subviscida]|uniref:Uncharacterized protein n=1 Tax=Psilocybe cf. subviscida TaxID=2480587 RepID=A0A8H5BFK3_9AGAR|nr:hypothetical protein D9619_000101 [Psilocybe cf. subviscida]